MYHYVVRLGNLLGKIGTDKYIHFNACLFSCFILTSLLEVKLSTFLATLIASILVFAMGYWKEFKDGQSYGGFDNNDLKADVLGILASIVITIIA